MTTTQAEEERRLSSSRKPFMVTIFSSRVAWLELP